MRLLSSSRALENRTSERITTWKKIRLQKVLSDIGCCSRRKAEELIARGKVKVNGHPAEIGMKIDPRADLISVGGQNLVVPRKKAIAIL